MLDKISKIFDLIKKVISIYGMAVSLTEMDLMDGESTAKEEKALDIADKALDDLVNRGSLPGWVKEIFFSEFLSRYIISITVKVAHKIDFFIKGGSTSEGGQ